MWVIELRLGKSMGRIKETLVRWMETFYLIYQLSKWEIKLHTELHTGSRKWGPGCNDNLLNLSTFRWSFKNPFKRPFKWGGKERK